MRIHPVSGPVAGMVRKPLLWGLPDQWVKVFMRRIPNLTTSRRKNKMLTTLELTWRLKSAPHFQKY